MHKYMQGHKFISHFSITGFKLFDSKRRLLVLHSFTTPKLVNVMELFKCRQQCPVSAIRLKMLIYLFSNCGCNSRILCHTLKLATVITT